MKKYLLVSSLPQMTKNLYKPKGAIMQYSGTCLDTKSLKRYAQQIAQETKRPLENGYGVEWKYMSEPKEVQTERKILGLFNVTETKTIQASIRKQTVGIGPHWELHRRNYHLHDDESEYYERHAWVLTPDGFLYFVYMHEDYYLNNSRRDEQGGSVEPMTEKQILRLDHKPDNVSESGSGWRAWGDRGDGPVLVKAKGDGLLSALTSLKDRH